MATRPKQQQREEQQQGQQQFGEQRGQQSLDGQQQQLGGKQRKQQRRGAGAGADQPSDPAATARAAGQLAKQLGDEHEQRRSKQQQRKQLKNVGTKKKRSKIKNMNSLLKWGIRGYLLVKLLKVVSLSSNRSPGENLKAIAQSFTQTKGALIALQNITSPGASLNPAAQQARNDARSQVPVVRTAMNLIGTVGSDVFKIGEWIVQQSENGHLVAVDKNGTQHSIAELADASPSGDSASSAGSDASGSGKNAS